MTDTYKRIYEIVKQIPCGKVATYGQVALLAGNPNMSRVVGNALHVNPFPGEVPCHRVVNRNGRASKVFAFGGEQLQLMLLENEGVENKDGIIDLKKYQWKSDTV